MPLEHSLIRVVDITNSGAYLEAASNVIPFAFPARSVFIRNPASPLYLTVATLMEKITGPLSAGSLRLASTDVRVNPIVRFNYFGWCVAVCEWHPQDRWCSEEDFKFRECFGAEISDTSGLHCPLINQMIGWWESFCRRTVSSIWHYHGGCLVGKVVDRNFRVIVIDAPRVVDGSIFTVSPGTNPQATLLMLGR